MHTERWDAAPPDDDAGQSERDALTDGSATGDRLPAVIGGDRVPARLTPDIAATEPVLIIPGTGVPFGPTLAPPLRHTRRAHTFVGIVALVAIVATAVLAGPLAVAATHGVGPFRALANAIAMPPPPDYVLYRVRPGDTFESIARHFGEPVGGIFELNHFYAGQEPQTGQVIRVSTHPDFGATYTPPPLIVGNGGPGITAVNVIGNCLFCSAGGWTNGPNAPCPPEGLAPLVDITRFGLIPPDPGSRWVRGYTWYHNGIDMTTGTFGSPILAAQTGVVIFAGWDPFGAGFSVKINHCGGLATSYSHMEKLLVSVGQAVLQGQVIGLQGSTGNSTGTHLHLMTWWNNAPFDPLCAYGTLDGTTWSAHYGGCPTPQASPGA